ncbi:hypothetical protein [Planctomycetes bacterium Poly30]
MKLSLRHLSVLALASSLLPSAGIAQITWTGAVGPGIFVEGNWDLTASTVTMLDPGVPILDNVRFIGPAPDARIPDLAGQGSFQVGDGFGVVIDGMRVFAAADDGLGSEPGASVGITVEVVNGASFEPYFVVNDTWIDIDSSSQVILGGPGDPLNQSYVNMTLGARLEFRLEDPTEFRNEHLTSLTVDGQPAVEGTNIRVDAVGNQGSLVTVLAAPLGTNYCAANVNSSGVAARMAASGSAAVGANQLSLECLSMPQLVFGFFIVSETAGFAANPGGSAGNLCLSGAVGRYIGAGQIQNSGPGGTIGLSVDLTAIPQPNGFVSVNAGETWRFQCWFRDSSGGAPTSNFSDGIEIPFS